MRYHWSNGRQLSAVTYVDENNEEQPLVSYTYDDFGIRTSKTYGDTVTYYTNIDGTITSQYQLEENGDVIELIEFLYDSADELIGFTYDGKTYFYVKNVQGDVTAVLDSSGTEVASYDYTAYGQPTDYVTGFAAVNPMRYRGYYYDDDFGAYYLQSRYYSPEFGRFLNSDLPEYAQVQKGDHYGTNLFAYCCNDPINNVDPSGYAYSPSKAKKYADKWWDGTNSRHYKRYDNDCANFVSQCLYAGGLSPMIKIGSNAWYYKPILYKPWDKSVYKALYSSSWVKALELGKWLYRNFANHDNEKFNYITTLKKLNKIGKILYKKPICSAAILLQWDKDGETHYHMMISGKVREHKGTYYIYSYGHTIDRDGMVTDGTYSSLQWFLKNKKFKKPIIRIYLLK